MNPTEKREYDRAQEELVAVRAMLSRLEERHAKVHQELVDTRQALATETRWKLDLQEQVDGLTSTPNTSVRQLPSGSHVVSGVGTRSVVTGQFRPRMTSETRRGFAALRDELGNA